MDACCDPGVDRGIVVHGFGLWVLHASSLDDLPRLQRGSAFVTAFVASFVAEMGDKTQFATVALATVVLGATIGMMLANVPAVWVGEKLAARMPMKAVRLFAATLFVEVGIITLWGAYTTAI
jgi:Ca2+/H+ antiporter, TMEM165/GDT1 family